jgi:hypothetical protein
MYIYVILKKKFIKAIELALSEGHSIEESERRKKLAMSHTWEDSVSRLYKAINHVIH